MLPSKIAFVDIETTGMRSFYDRVLEIGILRVENNQITKTYQSLLNPQSYIPREITMITGITAQDIESAPTFRQIKDEILDIMQDCVFAAHNVRFDYSFLKNEFQRENHTFSPRHFCTVRLSRTLFPQHRHHNLDSIIQRFGLACENRHRAFDDAKILYHFYQKIQQQFPQEIVDQAISKSMKQPSLPLRLKTDLTTISEGPGVYIFYGAEGAPLYVGKSINLRERIKSHFSADIRAPLEMKIAQQIESIETFPTAGELGALILESKLIKQLLPLYNKRSRLKRELTAIKSSLTDQGYQQAHLEPFSPTHYPLRPTPYPLPPAPSLIGIFKSKKQAKDYLIKVTKEHKLCEKLLGLEKTNQACFAYRLGNCSGTCIGKEEPLRYNLRFLMAFSASKIKPWPFPAAIRIRETNLERSEHFLVDQWCYLGSKKADNQDIYEDNTVETPAFDLDIYNILQQFIKNPKNQNKIRIISPTEQDAFSFT